MSTHIGPHKYVRIKIGKNKRVVFKCSILGCVHTCRDELIIGRKSICNSCGNEMFMTKLNTKLAKPHCDDCTKHKNKNVDIIGNLIEEMDL